MRTGRPKQALILTDEERDRLQSLAHRARSQSLMARRARGVGLRRRTRQQNRGAENAGLAGHGGKMARPIFASPSGRTL